MIWDMKTVAAIRGYTVRADIDISLIARYGHRPMDDFANRLFKELTRFIATSWPVEISREDCLIIKTEEKRGLMLDTYIMQWHPTDRPGEVMGGQHDGLTVPPPDAIGNYYPILRLPNDPDPSIQAMFVADPDTGEHPIITRENYFTAYEVTGWSDMHRRWIYTPTSPRKP